MMKNFKKIDQQVARCGLAAREQAVWPIKLRNRLLEDVAISLKKQSSLILKANGLDLKRAKKTGLSAAMLDRLTLDAKRMRAMIEGVQSVRRLPDPLGKIVYDYRRPDGLRVQRVTVPLGVILIIFESRPNVTVECAALGLKSGNTMLLRGGREAFASNQALIQVFQGVLAKHRLLRESVSFVDTTDYETVDYLLKQEGRIHLVIPRGGQGLIRSVVEKSHIPVVKHYQGICHIFVDDQVDLKQAANIIENAKLQRPSACNALETLLVHEKSAAALFKILEPKLKSGHCEIRGDQATCRLIPWAKKAKASDYGQEFLEKILAVKVVSGLEQAIHHIAQFGSGHTESILTKNKKHAREFIQRIDSSSVMVNASTRFADGFEYGLGAEIGISTDKVHARGPMGLEGLTSYKYIVSGNGHIRR